MPQTLVLRTRNRETSDVISKVDSSDVSKATSAELIGFQSGGRLRKRNARSTRSTMWAAACVVSGWCVAPGLGEM